jgi:hypothetical protein
VISAMAFGLATRPVVPAGLGSLAYRLITIGGSYSTIWAAAS